MEQLANVNDFEEYATCRESHYFDRKSSRIKVSDAAQHVVAFANASGGKLVIGIEDDGRITGFKQQPIKDSGKLRADCNYYVQPFSGYSLLPCSCC